MESRDRREAEKMIPQQRNEEEMMNLIRKTALEDDNIRAVLMTGSRSNPDAPKDKYQDYDIVFQVKDIKPYWDNEEWIEKTFGKPALMQKPESMQLIPPDGDGNYVYLMLFPDGNRIDLCLTEQNYADCGEPAIILLDKDGVLPEIQIRKEYWYVKKPDQKQFSDCCNEFFWCMNNVAKGIARDELSYAMNQYNVCVRDMLIQMLKWYVGAEYDFSVSAGKAGKYLKKYLPERLYEKFRKTYTDAEYEHFWNAVFEMLELFEDAAMYLSEKLNFEYRVEERQAIEAYLNRLRNE